MSNLLSVTEWCALHGKDPGNVRRMIAQGRIPAVKVGKQWVIDADTEPPADLRVKSGKYRKKDEMDE
ncbi:MAG: helix-turn-helix domain-containing protein [Oscillospiraceae bacterium]|nr:helix-turn-helix domain-containing protein [Oscillospiraceae bacterium]